MVRGGALRLRSPGTVVVGLPEQAGWVRVEAALDDTDAPPGFWEDADLVLRVDGLALTHDESADEGPAGREASVRLWRGQRSVAWVGRPTGEALAVTLDPGENGPVLDRVRLRAAALVVLPVLPRE